jgi:hypothetical protein
MNVPTVGETFSQMMEHVRKAQEASAMLAHLYNAEGKTGSGIAWLAVSENFKTMQHKLIELAKGRLQ